MITYNCLLGVAPPKTVARSTEGWPHQSSSAYTRGAGEMPKHRTVVPDFWDDPDVGKLSRDERLMFLGMVTRLADDEGRFLADPGYIRKELFGYDPDMSVEQVAAMRNRLVAAFPRSIILYIYCNQEYIAFANWKRHQTIKYIIISKLPDPRDGLVQSGPNCSKVDRIIRNNSEESGEKLPTFEIVPLSRDARAVGLSRVGLSFVKEELSRVEAGEAAPNQYGKVDALESAEIRTENTHTVPSESKPQNLGNESPPTSHVRKSLQDSFGSAPFHRFRELYETSGKPLNEQDWIATAHEVISQGITDEQWPVVIECLESELPSWRDRTLDRIPFPKNWVKKTPWTRKSKRKEESDDDDGIPDVDEVRQRQQADRAISPEQREKQNREIWGDYGSQRGAPS